MFGPIVSPDQRCVYELSAVLIHRGISAYSGHYIAHVKDARTGDWYKFNDEEIEKMEGKKLQLGIEEDIGEWQDEHLIGLPLYVYLYVSVLAGRVVKRTDTHDTVPYYDEN